jgi:uncharacterized Zn finger protein (UPF0148 family)
MGRETVVKCPKCGLPLARADDAKLRCQVCGFELEVADWGGEEALASPEEVKSALTRVEHILNSPMDRKINLSVSIGGEWAKRFAAVQAISEALHLAGSGKLVESIIKTGIGLIFRSCVGAAQWRAMSEEAVKHGALRQQTVDALYRELTRVFDEAPDKDWTVRRDENEEAES